MEYKAAVITMSDKGYQGLREDTAGDAIVKILENRGWSVEYRTMIPDDLDKIKEELIRCSDELKVTLVATTGGTGFSHRDVTPEATLQVVDREVRGIPEAMRAQSMKITPMGMLSRAAAGLRGNTLIINLPGSKKAGSECLEAVIDPIKHGVEVLLGESGDCAQLHLPHGTVKAICISEKKGEQKHDIGEATLVKDHGIEGDAHAGNWHRQVSLLAVESVAKVQAVLNFDLKAGDFAENILTEGIVLYTLPVGTKLTMGEAEAEVTQIGKECHHGCAIRELAGDCVMPREGIFVKILKGGKIKTGDSIQVTELP